MDTDSAYEALTEAQDDARWAFGTQPGSGTFPEQHGDDPLAGVDTTLPSGVDAAELETYCLMLADDALIASHRLQQWCTNAPELEDEVAIANIGLDLLGQARLLLARAGTASERGHGENHYAYFRDEHEFRNVRLVELPNGNFADSIARLLVFATWRLALLHRLTGSRDPVLAAVAACGVKEVTYHRDYAAQWLIRLGDGTEYSHQRTREALDGVWPLVDELFVAHPVERGMYDAGVGVAPETLRAEFDDVLARVTSAATLAPPEVPALAGVGGRTGRHGVHTESMGYILAELQSIARAHPEATW